MLNQEGILDMEYDQEMLELYKHLDALDGFKELNNAWLKVNSSNWHSNEIMKSIDRIFSFIGQLASYISIDHHEIKIQIQAKFDDLQGKQFATVIKRTTEWKELRKWFAQNHSFSNQTLTVRIICSCIMVETRKLIEIVK